LVQKSIDHFCLRYVADQTLTPEVEARIQAALRANGLWETTEVACLQVSEIGRAESGKFMVTLCELPG